MVDQDLILQEKLEQLEKEKVCTKFYIIFFINYWIGFIFVKYNAILLIEFKKVEPSWRRTKNKRMWRK